MGLSSLNIKINKHLGHLQNRQGYHNILDMKSKALILNYYLQQVQELPDSYEKKMLSQAIHHDLEIVNRNAPENLGDFSQQILQMAIENNDSELLEALIHLQPELVIQPLVNSNNKMKKNALIMAVSLEHINLVKQLVAVKDMDINYGNRTALDEAISIDHLELVKILIQAGAEPSQGSLQIACSHGYLNVVKELAKLFKHQSTSTLDYNTVLMQTITLGQLDCIRYLVNELGADVNFAEEKITPLILAIQYREPAIARFLKESGADLVKAKQFFKMTELGFAAFLGDRREITLQLLSEKGKNELNTCDKEGCTPLMRAVHHGNPTQVMQLIDAGANINSTQKTGNTALIDAVRSRNKAVVEVLLNDDSLEIAAHDNDKYYTARDLALSNKDMHIVHALDQFTGNRLTKQRKQQMTKELFEILDLYLGDKNQKVLGTGNSTKEYLRSYILGFFQINFSQKGKAVEALRKALNGEEVDLAAHLTTLRNGNLGKKLRAFVRAGHANHLADSEINSVSAMVTALHTKVNPIREHASNP